MRTRNFVKSIALVATTLSAGVAPAAEGEYYEGASKRTVRNIDAVATGSIGNARSSSEVRSINSGDYYSGANRPN